MNIFMMVTHVGTLINRERKNTNTLIEKQANEAIQNAIHKGSNSVNAYKKDSTPPGYQSGKFIWAPFHLIILDSFESILWGVDCQLGSLRWIGLALGLIPVDGKEGSAGQREGETAMQTRVVAPKGCA